MTKSLAINDGTAMLVKFKQNFFQAPKSAWLVATDSSNLLLMNLFVLSSKTAVANFVLFETSLPAKFFAT